jgi:hypothetical protein
MLQKKEIKKIVDKEVDYYFNRSLNDEKDFRYSVNRAIREVLKLQTQKN